MKNKKKFDLGILVGRFQGIHKGHGMMIDTALSLCDEVAVLVGSSQESGTEKNPFTYDIRRKMLDVIYGGKIRVFPLPDIGVGNCAEWGEYVMKSAKGLIGKTPSLFVSGKETRRSNWFDGKLGEAVTELYIPKTIEISASEIRDLLIDGDEENWRSFSDPAIWDMYDELRRDVISSMNNKKTKSI